MTNVVPSFRPSMARPRAARGRVIVAVAVGLLLRAGVAAAQGPVIPVPTVRLASPQAPPGGETFVTVMLANDPNQPIQTVNTEIEFQANQLTYVSSRLGFAGDVANAALDVKVTPVAPTAPAPAAGAPPNPASRPRTRIALKVSGKKTIPNGPLVELRFKVGPAFLAADGGVADAEHSATAGPGAKPAPPATPAAPQAPARPADGTADVVSDTARVVIIKVTNNSTAVNAQGANVPLIAEAGEVAVTTERKGAVPMVFACYFYMH